MILVGTPLSLHGRSEFAEVIHRLTDPVTEEWVRNFLSGFPLAHRVPGWFFDDRVREGAAMPAHACKAIFNGLCTAPPPTESGTIDSPTLLLWGARDGGLSMKEQETLAGRIAGAKLKVYPDAGHLVLWEYPERVAQDTTAFLGALH